MPRLETPRLLLRTLQASDVAVLVAIWADPDVTRYMGGPRDGERVRQTLEDELGSHSEDRLGFCTVVEKASGRVIGDCGLTKKEVDGRDEVELVYVFAADAWGKGYATEAASAMRDYAIGELRLPRLIALIDPENVASARVAEKVGMQLEKEVVRPSGVLRHVYAMSGVAS
jgi:ribosomal-protein-alanine N-acetyltransferase